MKTDLLPLEQGVNHIDFLKIMGIINGDDHSIFAFLVFDRHPVIITHKRNFKAGQQVTGNRHTCIVFNKRNTVKTVKRFPHISFRNFIHVHQYIGFRFAPFLGFGNCLFQAFWANQVVINKVTEFGGPFRGFLMLIE